MKTLWTLAFAALMLAAPPNTTYVASIDQWRAERERLLKADDGWLTVAGLFWLKEGANTCGTDPQSDIVLPAGAGATRLGAFELQHGRTTFRSATGEVKPMKADTDGEPDVVTAGDVTMFVIHRGERYGIRLKDRNSRFRKEFTGLRWFPIREQYRVVAKFVPYPEPKMIAVPNILGETEKDPCPGYALFTLDGKEYRLEPVLEDQQYFFIFRDLTAGKATYPAGRFFYADAPKDGKIVLDFNRAYNPPCAFTPFATCPLPPPGNRLAVRIEAGELNYPHHW